MKDFGEYLPNISLKPSESFLQDVWSKGNQRTGFFPLFEERGNWRERWSEGMIAALLGGRSINTICWSYKRNEAEKLLMKVYIVCNWDVWISLTATDFQYIGWWKHFLQPNLKGMLIPPYFNEQICSNEVLLLSVLMNTSSAISEASGESRHFLNFPDIRLAVITLCVFINDVFAYCMTVDDVWLLYISYAAFSLVSGRFTILWR